MDEKRRLSPRWKTPLVEEYPPPPTLPIPPSNESSTERMAPGTSQNYYENQQHGPREMPTPRPRNGQRTTGTRVDVNGNRGENYWDDWRRPFDDGEQPFFSREFYEAFPHLRPTNLGKMPPERRRNKSAAYHTDEYHPEFSSYLDRFDQNWRNDPFWRDLYPRWAEPIFKDGIDVKTNITNDSNKFAVEVDTYQFRPEEIQVKTMDDTLLIEGRHEDVRDRDNYTKMYFVRKYQLPTDVEPRTISSHIDGTGRLTVEAKKAWPAIESGRERSIPIDGAIRRYGSRSSSYSPRDRYWADSGRGSANGDYYRSESRYGGGGGDYLSPQSNGYQTGFERRETNANGMRHEARREEFREERRTGSAANMLPPPSPIFRTSSRLSAADGGLRESSQHFHRSSSQQRNEYRQYSSGNGSTSEHLLRPAPELGGTSTFGRSVPIQRA